MFSFCGEDENREFGFEWWESIAYLNGRVAVGVGTERAMRDGLCYANAPPTIIIGCKVKLQ